METNLTPAERRILKLILAGKSNQEIADEIRCKNDHRLRNSISRIYSKIGASGPRDLLPRVSELQKICDNVST